MPGQRAKGQKLIPVPMSEKFIADIDRAFRTIGYDDRSKFIRAAVREKLQRMGYPVETEETMAPTRVRYIIRKKGAPALTEAKGKPNVNSSSKTGSVDKIQDTIVEELERRKRSAPSRSKTKQ